MTSVLLSKKFNPWLAQVGDLHSITEVISENMKLFLHNLNNQDKQSF